MTTRVDLAGAKLGPITGRRFSVGKSDDPYKKYWLAILACMGFTGAWVCIPIMDPSIGSARIGAAAKSGADAGGADQSLDFADNPSGAPGGAVDLSMIGASHKSGKDGSDGEDPASMLYQAPPGGGLASAPGTPLVDASAASAASLAQQLKDAGVSAGKADDKNAAGWNEKAQAGFISPHLAGGALPGLGSASGKSSASAGGANQFGSKVADPTFVASHGLHDDGVGIRALKAAAASVGGGGSNARVNDEAAHAAAGQSFDGGRNNGGRTVNMDRLNALGQAQVSAGQAPANLKANNPMDVKKLPLPTPPAATPPNQQQQMMQQMMMMVATTIVGGLVNGLMGSLMGGAGAAGLSQPTSAMSSTLTGNVATMSSLPPVGK